MASWFTGAMEAVGIGEAVGEVVADPRATTAATSSGEWWSKGLQNALPQILKVTGQKAGSGRGPTASASAKPVAGNASSAMQVPQMIGKAASQSPLDNLNQWSNLF
ncbi:hypothetical protein [Buttiauxella sp. A111]|uniref:hypothetical protein n=1 Tax=Buttiauxella sp. A111 TaxID=2563088 RepID=UPI001621D5AA|nr:hypothetical protein [Buttiauxella sp. A111]